MKLPLKMFEMLKTADGFYRNGEVIGFFALIFKGSSFYLIIAVGE